jgi:coproporphyrinogen III oxidase-like Fe-S oxidoreductase
LSNKDRAIEILKSIENLNISIFVEVLPQFVDEDVADAFKEVQRPVVGLGVQTLNRESQRAVRRVIPQKTVDNAFKLLKDALVTIKLDLILGLPHETKKTYLESLEYAMEKADSYHKCYLSLEPLVVLPGTEMEDIAKETGYKWDDDHVVVSTPRMSEKEVKYLKGLNEIGAKIFCAKASKLGTGEQYWWPKWIYRHMQWGTKVKHVKALEMIQGC